jgi:hypothetical protein
VTSYPTILSRALMGGMMLVLFGASPAASEQINNASYLAHVNVDVLPVAEISIIGPGLLYLNVPPPGSTVPSSGVQFIVSGNANASLVAEPSQFVEVAGEGFMGKAVLNAGDIGYKLELRFPKTGVPLSPVAIAALPGYEAGPTTPPLSVNLMATGGQRGGVIHMESDPNWTSDGGIPLPGLYVGQVTLTLTAF